MAGYSGSGELKYLLYKRGEENLDQVRVTHSQLTQDLQGKKKRKKTYKSKKKLDRGSFFRYNRTLNPVKAN